jgi:hypothetical protein
MCDFGSIKALLLINSAPNTVFPVNHGAQCFADEECFAIRHENVTDNQSPTEV